MRSTSNNRPHSTSPVANFLHYIDADILEIDGLYGIVNPRDCYLFCHIHCLPSYVTLLRFLITNFGFLAEKMFVIPKAYSAIEASVTQLKALGVTIIEAEQHFTRGGEYDRYASIALKMACDRGHKIFSKRRRRDFALLLDDGGMLTETWYRLSMEREVRTVSVQQTQSGIYRDPTSLKLLKINVAGSAAKRWFESKIIAGGVTRKIASSNHIFEKKEIGIIGYGALGKAVAELMSKHTQRVSIFDRALNFRSDKYINRLSIRDLFESSEVIFGCTGRNCFAGHEKLIDDPYLIRAERLFVSCSSRNVEFLSILHKYHPEENDVFDAFADMHLGSSRGTILNGGFPINFDRTREWETEQEISLTRGLILAGILQAMSNISDMTQKLNIIPLGIKTQKLLVKEWLNICNKSCEEFGVSPGEFDSEGWWKRESFYVGPSPLAGRQKL